MDPQERYQHLLGRLAAMQGVLVAYSGGVDSTVLAVAAREALGERMICVLASSPIYPERELVSARELALVLKLPLVEIRTDELDHECFSANPADRCYYCKLGLFGRMRELASERGLERVADGTNADDLADHRPGRIAAREMGVATPLADEGLTKAQIREVATMLGLPNAEKPSMACLASRFPYDERIDAPGLARVAAAEDALADLGLSQVRVRTHGPVARVEVAPDELDSAWALRDSIARAVKAAGFDYVALDLEGYMSGSLNRVLPGSTSTES